MSEAAVHLLQAETPVQWHAGAWRVAEATELRIVTHTPCEMDLDGRPLPWHATDRGARVTLPFAVGRLTLTVRRTGSVQRFPIDVAPADNKLRSQLWMAMLSQLDEWLPGVIGGVEGPRQGGLALMGRDTAVAVEALLPLLPAYERALALVAAHPRTLEQHAISERPIHRARHATSGALSWISRHPREAAWLNPHADADLIGLPPLIPLDTYRDTLDHPANRYIVWQLGRIVTRLTHAADHLSKATVSDLNHSRVWRDARVTALRRAAHDMQRILRTGPLRTVRPAPANGAALLVLLDDPQYARAHRLGRRILRSGLHGTLDQSVATRPSFHLYELWCLLAVQRALAEVVGNQWKWRLYKKAKLLSLLGSGSGAVWKATHPSGRELKLLFNPRFQSLLTKSSPNKRHSITAERRPDLCITSGDRWLVLDAKYRVGQSALGDAFTSAHVYRDALRWPAHGGRPTQALLLAPRADATTSLWFEPAFAKDNGVGAVALTPGSEHSDLPHRLEQALLGNQHG